MSGGHEPRYNTVTEFGKSLMFTRELSTIPNRGAPADRGGIGRSAEPRLVVCRYHLSDGPMREVEIRAWIAFVRFSLGERYS
jgi:hypothetical protein